MLSLKRVLYPALPLVFFKATHRPRVPGVLNHTCAPRALRPTQRGLLFERKPSFHLTSTVPVALIYDKGASNAAASGAPRYCPRRVIDYKDACVWYQVPPIPTLAHTATTHIAPNPLTEGFVPPEVGKDCNFHFPHTTGMWYHALQSGSIEPFVQPMKSIAPFELVPRYGRIHGVARLAMEQGPQETWTCGLALPSVKMSSPTQCGAGFDGGTCWMRSD